MNTKFKVLQNKRIHNYDKQIIDLYSHICYISTTKLSYKVCDVESIKSRNGLVAIFKMLHEWLMIIFLF